MTRRLRSNPGQSQTLRVGVGNESKTTDVGLPVTIRVRRSRGIPWWHRTTRIDSVSPDSGKPGKTTFEEIINVTTDPDRCKKPERAGRNSDSKKMKNGSPFAHSPFAHSIVRTRSGQQIGVPLGYY